MRDNRGYIEQLGLLIVTLLAIGVGWWGLSVMGTLPSTGLAALGFACFLLTPAAWLAMKVHGAAISGSAGAVMMVAGAVLGSIHP
jgi:hypothetical protein